MDRLRYIVVCIILFITMPLYAEPGDIASKLRIFTWEANTESDLAGYKLYHQTEFLIAITDPLATSFECQVEGLLEGENIFNMTAYDTSGNESLFSKDAIFIYDSIAPAVPTEVVVNVMNKTRVTIETW